VASSTRREARERALGLAYEAELRGMETGDVLLGLAVQADEYAERLARGVQEHLDAIDALLRKYSEHWALERMPAVDRALLRIGAYELAYEPETPTGVVISEAVELAKQYSTKDSGRFVNGLLSRVAADVRAGDQTEPSVIPSPS
jgi:N utilization substance protein B